MFVSIIVHLYFLFLDVIHLYFLFLDVIHLYFLFLDVILATSFDNNSGFISAALSDFPLCFLHFSLHHLYLIFLPFDLFQVLFV